MYLLKSASTYGRALISVVDFLPSAWAGEGGLNLQAVSATHSAFITSSAGASTSEIPSVPTSTLVLCCRNGKICQKIATRLAIFKL